MSSKASLNAQAVGSDGKNWTLTIGHDGETALYLNGQGVAKLDAESARAILTAGGDASERLERLLVCLEQTSGSIDDRAREDLLRNEGWISVHWQ